MAILLKVFYWVAVLIISLILLVVLVRYFEGRDSSGIDEGSQGGAVAAAVSSA